MTDCKLKGRKLEDYADALCHEAANTLAARDAEIARLREIVRRYGDRIPMANAPAHLQQSIDEALGGHHEG